MKVGQVAVHLNRDEFLTPFDRLFDDMVQTHFPHLEKECGISFTKGSFPKVDVVEYDDNITIVAEIPWLSKKSLSIEVDDMVLSISGDKHQLDMSDARYLRKELKHSSFCRSFQLSDSLDVENISSTFNDGVLSIEIPKKEPKPNTKIKVPII